MNHKNQLFRPVSIGAIKPRRKNYLFVQAGLTLIEVIVSLAILSAATVGMSMVADQYSQDTKGSVTASQMRTFGEASKSYIKDNYAAIQSIATATAPALIDVPTLITAGKLPTGFLAINAFGQNMCTLVLLPAANRLQAMVVTEGGTAIEDLALGTIAATVGGSGGGVYASNAAIMRGAIGGWSLDTSTYHNLSNNVVRHCDGSAGNVQVTAGHPLMALWFENGDTSSAFLSRDAVPGRPELNVMNTPLVMNSVKTVATACTTTGAIAQDGTGSILTCQSGLWKVQGDSKCVETTADLNTLQDDGRCFSGQGNANSPSGGDGFFVEVYRRPNPLSFYTVQKAFGMTGSSVGKSWSRNQQSTTSGAGWSAWNLTSVQGSAGGACAPDGQLAQSSDGSNLICVNGTYKPISDMVGKMGLINVAIYSTGQVVATPVCSPTLTALIVPMGVVSACVVGGGTCANNTGSFRGSIGPGNVVSVTGSDGSVAGSAQLTVASLCSAI